MRMRKTQALLDCHLAELKTCVRCPEMKGPVVVAGPVVSKVFLVGQAPGPREGILQRPFAWTAGKTLFGWFARIGGDEASFRQRAYIAAVCRCFPGKTAHGGDRVPTQEEILCCADWMRREIELLQPELILPVGRLAIVQFIAPGPLASIIGKAFRVNRFGHECDAIPLPHPSGASTWFKKEPGRTLLARALKLIAKHPAWLKGG